MIFITGMEEEEDGAVKKEFRMEKFTRCGSSITWQAAILFYFFIFVLLSSGGKQRDKLDFLMDKKSHMLFIS